MPSITLFSCASHFALISAFPARYSAAFLSLPYRIRAAESAGGLLPFLEVAAELQLQVVILVQRVSQVPGT
jgi:hypothetical protein